MSGTFPRKSTEKLRFNRTYVRVFGIFYGFAVGPPRLRCGSPLAAALAVLRLRPFPPCSASAPGLGPGCCRASLGLSLAARMGSQRNVNRSALPPFGWRSVSSANVGGLRVGPAGSPSPSLPGPRSSPRPPPAPPGRPPSPGPRFRAVRLIPCGGGSLGGGPLSAPFGFRAICPRSRLVRLRSSGVVRRADRPAAAKWVGKGPLSRPAA